MYKLLSIVCLASLPFMFSLHGDFVFDDSEAIVKNKDIYSESWVEPFHNDFWGTNIKSNLSHKSYRPLSILAFRLNYLLSGKQLSAVHFKITNLCCHILCCILVWITFQRILNTQGGAKWNDTAYLSTLLFAVHPIHVEAVSGIVGRADILAANTFFLSFLLYCKSMTTSRFKYVYLLAAVIASGMSMLFKENGVTVLGFSIVYELVTKIQSSSNAKTNKTKITSNMVEQISLKFDSFIRIVFITFAAVMLLYARWVIMGGMKPEFKPTDNPAAFTEDVFTKMKTYNYIYFLNFLLLVWPQWLCYDWSMGCVPLVENNLDYRIVLVLLMYIYALLMLKAITSRGNEMGTKRAITLAGSLTVIPFLPAANILYPVGFVIAERILYIPSAGYCLLITIGLNKIIRGTGIRCKVAIFMYLLLLSTYSLRSWRRSVVWQNEYNLFVSGLSVCPLNAKVHYNVAKAADAKQHTEWALAEYRESIRLHPQYYQAMNNLANLLKNQKQFGEAEFYLRSAVKHKQDFPAAWMNLGIVLASTKRYNESETAYKTALTYRRNYPDCLYNLGNLYLEVKNTKAAMENWFQAINLNSKHVLAWTNLMALLDNTGKIDEALKLIPKVLEELPESPSINFAIANIYGKIDHYQEAESHFKQAIKLFDKKVQAIHFANLGVLYHRWKKYNLAEEMYRQALKIDPKFKSALRNLNSLQKIAY